MILDLVYHLYRRGTGRYCKWFCPRCAEAVRNRANGG